MDAQTTAKRIRAAMELGGFSSVRALAGHSDLSYNRTRELVEGRNYPAKDMELREIARVCNVPEAFVMLEAEDLERVLDGRPTRGDQAEMEHRMERLERLLEHLRAGNTR